MKLHRVFILVLCTTAAGVGCAPPTKNGPARCRVDPCEGMGPWREFGTLIFSFSDIGGKTGDVLTYYSLGRETHNTVSQPSAEPYSKMHMIPGAAILYSGRVASFECAQLNDTPDTPTVMVSYATQVLFYLGRVAPAGPDAVQGFRKVFAEEQNAPTRLQVDPGNYISFKSPWEVEGTLDRKNADTVRFELKETLSGEVVEERQITGSWSKSAHIQ